MNDPIEERLARMQPAPVPNELMVRLIAGRPQAATTPPWRTRLVPAWSWGLPQWTCLIALLVALSALAFPILKSFQANSAKLAQTAASAPQSPRIFLPVEERNYLVRTDDLGIVEPDSLHPVRLVRTVWVDDATFRGTDGVSRARLTQPREQIIPVALEIY
jgi:hypothetical protein